ncbi:MAG: hypothetical protein WCB01_03475, partial [Candidatus Cybelea sp.]
QLFNTPIFAVYNNSIGINHGAEVRLQDRQLGGDEWFLTGTVSVVCGLHLGFGVPVSAEHESSGCSLRCAALARRPQPNGRFDCRIHAPVRSASALVRDAAG